MYLCYQVLCTYVKDLLTDIFTNQLIFLLSLSPPLALPLQGIPNRNLGWNATLALRSCYKAREPDPV